MSTNSKKKIGLGTWAWGNEFFWKYNKNADLELRDTLKEAIKRGFAIIDTADSYGTGKLSGRSEKLLGNFLSEIPKSEKRRIEIATKLAPYPWRIGAKAFSKPFLESLNRLRHELDIVQIHWSTARYNPWQEFQLLENLSNLIDEGYRFKIGLSNIGPKRLQTIINFLASKNKTINSVQVQFSLLSPDIEKQRVLKKVCEENNIQFIAYSPLSFGILCQDPISIKKTSKSLLRNSIFKAYSESTLELRKIIKEIAEKRSVSMAQVAVNWCCYQGAIPLVGLRKKSHVLDISRVLKWDLTKSEYCKLEELSQYCNKLPGNPFSSN